MTDVINIISQITNKYGNQIITESRFVHIFNDLYPSRNNPAYANILKSIISDGCSSDLLKCTKKNIKIKVEDTATRLATQYGYDKNVVSEMLYSLAIGSNVISQSDYNKINEPTKPKPKKKNSKPNNSSNSNSSKQKTKNPNSSFSVQSLLFLLLGYIGVLISPFIMILFQTGQCGLFLTTLMLIILHSVTILPCAWGLKKVRPNSIIGGMFCGLLVFTGVYMMFGPLGYDRDLLEFLGYWYSWESPFFLSELFTIIVGFVYLACAGYGAEIAGIDTSPFYNGLFDSFTQGKYYSGGIEWMKPVFQSLMNLKYLLGLGLSAVIICIGWICYKNFPQIYCSCNNTYIETIYNRSQQVQTLSFADFRLRDNMDSCLAFVSTSKDYHYLNDETGYYNHSSLLVKGRDYSSYVDSVYSIRTEWDNDSIVVNLFSYKNRIFAIELLPEYSDHNLLEMYKNKYGRSEVYYDNKKNNSISYFSFNNKYFWTYNNCLIQLSIGRHYGSSSDNVIYIDRQLDNLIDRRIEEAKRQEEMEQKRQEELQRKEDEEEQKRLLDEQNKRKQNHNNSINKI